MPILTAQLAHIARQLVGLDSPNLPQKQRWTVREVYELLNAYYLSNGLYQDLSERLKLNNVHVESITELRNPTFAAVEFYPKKLWPGDLDKGLRIEADNEAIIEPLQRIRKWSNWAVKKQAAARFFARDGDMFLKVATRTDLEGRVTSVYWQLIQAKFVTDFRVDERGFVTFLRYEVYIKRKNDRGDEDIMLRTEIWRKDVGMRVYVHEEPIGTDEDELGEPELVLTFDDLGFDFVPWVHAPFIDLGSDEDGAPRGLPLIWPVISKIDDVHRKATRLSELLFQFGKPLLVLLANQVDTNGIPLPPPDVDVETIGDNDYLKMPGVSDIKYTVPPIDWQAHAQEIMDMLAVIKTDLPEIAYYALSEKDNLSGKALRFMLAPAVDRALEARGNGYTAMARAGEMALHIGKLHELFPETIGTFENGDFDHTFSGPEVIELSEDEKATVVKTYRDAGVSLSVALVRYAGWSTEDAEAEERKAGEGAPNNTPEEDVADDVSKEAVIQEAGKTLERELGKKLNESLAKKTPPTEEIRQLIRRRREAAAT